MRKVFFIGKFNTLFEETNNYLVQHFNVQVCVDNLTMIQSILKLSKPDVFVISLLGMGEEKTDILNELRNNYQDIPVVCMVPQGENLSEEQIIPIKKYQILTMPVDNEKLVESICEVLELQYDNDNRIVLDVSYEKKCVLAIDDNSFQLRMLNELLKDKYDVQMATSAVKALTMIGKRVPDVILLDYEMPVYDGKMTLQMIREIEAAKNVPVIFLTGVRDTEHIKAVLELHPAGYILKPAKGEILMEEIEKHIR